LRTRAVRLYGQNDLRLEEFDLAPIRDDELLMRVVSDSLCTSTYKAVIQGSKHKRVPADIDVNPIVVGHEMCGEVIQAGANLRETWQPGARIVIQPALNLPGSDYSVGYSFPQLGGSMTYGVIPREIMEQGCVLPYRGSYFRGSMVEPLSCILRAFQAMYHIDPNSYERLEGAKDGGKIAILGGAGPMGLGAIDIALHKEKPAMVVVTDIDAKRLERAARIFSVEDARQKGINLIYVDVSKVSDQVEYLQAISGGGFDDILVMIPNQSILEIADQVAGRDCCINFFAGPTDKEFSVPLNFYRVHYDSVHVLGTSGGSPEDTIETIKLIEQGVLHPEALITHIGGLDSVIDSLLSITNSEGLKKICYPDVEMPMTAIADFGQLGEDNELFRALDQIVQANNGLWCDAAEQHLLEHAGTTR